MKSYPNIEKSARKGEYVGYTDQGKWRIKRSNSSYGNWAAWPDFFDEKGNYPQIISAFGLDKMSDKLAELNSKKNPGRRAVHTKKFDRCVKKVARKSGKRVNAYAVCMTSLGKKKAVKKAHRKNPVRRHNLYRMRKRPDGDYDVVGPRGKIVVEGEGYQIASNIEYELNHPEHFSTSEAGEVARSIRKNPAARPLTRPGKQRLIAGIDQRTYDVGFFNGTHLQPQHAAAILYPSSAVAMQAARKLKHPAHVVIVVAPAHYGRAEIQHEAGIRKNPVDAREVGQAARRLEAFTGHRARTVTDVPLHVTKTGYALGKVHAMSYIAKRDGETSVYHHEFKPTSRPSLVATADGKALVLAGGRYKVTDRGIVDT